MLKGSVWVPQRRGAHNSEPAAADTAHTHMQLLLHDIVEIYSCCRWQLPGSFITNVSNTVSILHLLRPQASSGDVYVGLNILQFIIKVWNCDSFRGIQHLDYRKEDQLFHGLLKVTDLIFKIWHTNLKLASIYRCICAKLSHISKAGAVVWPRSNKHVPALQL